MVAVAVPLFNPLQVTFVPAIVNTGSATTDTVCVAFALHPETFVLIRIR